MTLSLMSEGGAPENFHISFTNDDNDSNLSASTTRCPLCNYTKRNFHCKNCIRQGFFFHSTHHILERFSEKQLRYKNLTAAHATLESKCVKLLEHRRLNCQLRAEIKQRTENISIIRKLMALKRENVSKLQALQKKLRESNHQLREKLPRCADQVKKMGVIVQSKSESNERKLDGLRRIQNELKQFRKEQVDKLIRDIFPISQVINNRSSFSSSDGERNTATLISDATRMAYVRDQWVLQDSYGEIQHIIVAPVLPGNGNYSAYNDWATLNTATDASSSGRSEDAIRNVASKNPAHTIAGALTFTAQLVQIMCFYLDIRLPYKVSYCDFCTTALSELQFNRKVARLNANILYLCYTQGCRLNELIPSHTLENIQQLMKSTHADLGRFGPMDRNLCLNEHTDAALTQHLGVGDDSDSDDESNIHKEWEAVPSNLPAANDAHIMLAGTAGGTQLQYGNTHYYQQNYHHHHPQHQGTATSLMTSAVASVTSLWKGWTWGK